MEPKSHQNWELAPSSIYKKPDPMLEIENSTVEPAEGDVPAVESAKPELSTRW